MTVSERPRLMEYKYTINIWILLGLSVSGEQLGTLPNRTLASRKGFEPLTPGLGNRCSILLSYRDMKCSASIGVDRFEAEQDRG